MPDNKEKSSAIARAIEDAKRNKGLAKDRDAIVAAVAKEFVSALSPVLAKIPEVIAASIKEIKIDSPNVTVPAMEVRIPDIKMPKIPAPIVNVPQPIVHVKAPVVQVPPPKPVDFSGFQMPEVALKGVGNKSPLPVVMMGLDGKPMLFPGGGGGVAKSIQVNDIRTRGGNSVYDETNDALQVNVVAGSLTANTEYDDGDSPATIVGIVSMGEDEDFIRPMQFGSGRDSLAIRMVLATNVASSVEVRDLMIGDVSIAANEGVLNDQTLRIAHAVDSVCSVNIVSGSSSNTEYTQDVSPATGTIVGIAMLAEDEDYLRTLQVGSGRDSLALRVVHATNVASSMEFVGQQISMQTLQLSGAIDSVEIASLPFTLDTKQLSGLSDSVNVLTIGGDAVAKAREIAENDGGFLRVIHATDIGMSVAVRAVDVSLEVKQVSGFSDSVNIATINELATGFGSGVDNAGVLRMVHVVDVAASAQSKLIARQTNPTAVADAAPVFATADDLGRQVMVLHQVRDLTQTAYAEPTTGIETTLLAGVASTFHDLVYIMGANHSDAAVSLDIRAGTANGIVASIEIPANGTAGVAPSIPIPQDVVANTWTIQNTGTDVSGTPVDVTALFVKNV